MKKSLVALAVAAAVPAFAQAQTSIQLIGSVDVAVESLNKEASSSGKSDLQINDGIWGGSRVGIVGSEDLGNGLKAIFNLEYRARADTGRLANSTRFWQGQSWVGLDGGFGTIKLGRQAVALSYAIEAGDLTGQSWYYSSDALAGYTSKRDNSISYATPSLGGFKLYAGYGAGESEATNVAAGDVAKQGDYYSVAGVGDWGAFTFGVGYLSVDGGKINNVKRTNELGASIGTKIGPFGAGLAYAQNETKPVTGASVKDKGYFGNLSYQVSDNGTAYLTYRREEFKRANNNKTSGVGLTYAHGLSKRTFVYGAVGIGKAEVPGQDNTKPRRIALGVRHFF